MHLSRFWGLSLLLISLAPFHVFAQTDFPSIDVLRLDGSSVAISELVGQGKPTVVAIWATWCQPCHMELDHMKPYYSKWTTEYNAEVLAVSVDQPYHMRRIQPLMRRRNWPYPVVVDVERELHALLGIESIPQLYILDEEGRIVASFNGFDNARVGQVDRELAQLRTKR